MKVNKFLLLIILSIILVALCTGYLKRPQIKNKIGSIENYIKRVDTIIVEATCYNAEASQCDSDYLTTADCTHIYNEGKQRIVAVSRNLKKIVSFGDTIFVYSNNKLIAGKWIVRDLKNKRYKNSIDFLVKRKHNRLIGRIDELKFSIIKK